MKLPNQAPKFVANVLSATNKQTSLWSFRTIKYVWSVLKWLDVGHSGLRLSSYLDFFKVCFVWLKESNFKTRKNVFYFASKTFFALEIIRF